MDIDMKLPEKLQLARDTEFDRLYSADATGRIEIVLRYVIVLAAGTALWIGTSSWLIPLWAVGYVTLNSVYVMGLYKTAVPVSGERLAVLLSASAFVAMWFSLMPIYISSLNNGAFVVLAMCGCGGVALHALSRNAGFSMSAYIDVFVTMFMTFFVFAFAVSHTELVWQKATIIVGGISISGYFLVSFFEIIAVRQALSDKLKADAQDQKMRSLGQLTSGIAHDFNNLLTVIGGNIDLAQLDPQSPDSTEYLNNARLATNRSSVLIKNLLAYARKSHLRTERLSAGQLLNRIESILLRVLPANIDLRILQIEDPAFVDIDQAMLENAILNLAINARDALVGQPGQIIIETSLNRNRTEVLLSVKDDGPGMTSATLDNATDPFFTTKGVGEGSGLGLSMVKGFAEQSGGTLHISNRSPKGLSAELRLPVVRDSNASFP